MSVPGLFPIVRRQRAAGQAKQFHMPGGVPSSTQFIADLAGSQGGHRLSLQTFNRVIEMNEMILLKLGEMVLKGLNRRSFEDKLQANIYDSLSSKYSRAADRMASLSFAQARARESPTTPNTLVSASQAPSMSHSSARLLTPWCGRLTVHVVPFTAIQEELRRMAGGKDGTAVLIGKNGGIVSANFSGNFYNFLLVHPHHRAENGQFNHCPGDIPYGMVNCS